MKLVKFVLVGQYKQKYVETGCLMIISLRFSNFYSFLDETFLSFELGQKPAGSKYDVHLCGKRLNKALAVVGANGAGKTQLIKPLAFLTWFIRSSFLHTSPDENISFRQHKLGIGIPTTLELNFLMKGEEYKYKLELSQSHVIHESLHKKTSRLYSYIFVRDYDSENEDKYFIKQKNFGFRSSQAKSIRKNASLISAAFNYDVPMAAEFVEYFSRWAYNVNVSGRDHFNHSDVFSAASYFESDNELSARMSEVMCSFDLGLNSVSLQPIEIVKDEGGKSNGFIPVGHHVSPEGEFELPLFEESSGTQSAFVLLRAVLPVLENGGLAIIDEIDNDLHPHMLPILLDMFKSKSVNRFDGQIVFTCHTPEVLNLLQKHQVYLVEKFGQRSQSYRLDDVVGLRADDNLYAKYMTGALGAVPNL